jgi:hypothetical protein
LEFAQKMLNEHGEFFPFGSALDPSGKVISYGVDTGDGDEHPPSQRVIDILVQAYAQKAQVGELRAVAICADVRVVPPGESSKTDAISVGLEHQSGEAVNVFQPYRKGWFGRIRYGEMFALERAAQFFRRSENS